MRLLTTIAAALLSISLPSIVAAQTDDNICVIHGINADLDDPDDLWARFRQADNPFNNLIDQNCWWPVARDNSSFFIKAKDHGAGEGRGRHFHPEGWSGTMPKEVWVLGRHARDASVRYRRSMSLYRFSCNGEVRRFALLKFTAFSASGEILEDQETSDASWRIAIPDSREHSLAGFVCGGDISPVF